MNISKIAQKKAILDLLADDLFSALDYRERAVKQTYKVVGTSNKQATDWKTGELKYDEVGNPIYEKEYDYVDKTPEEFSESDLATLSAIELVRNTLEKLI